MLQSVSRHEPALAHDDYGGVTITTFTHSDIQLEYGGKVIHIDPWSVSDLSKAKPADLILITDDVDHHLDPKAIARVRKPGAPVVIAANGMKQVPDGIVMANGETREIAGIQVEATAAYDIKPGEPYHPKGEANGYIITLGGARIYVAGVTECVPEVRGAKNIDVAFFAINVPLERMEPAAAIECLTAMKPKVVYPYHYDQEWVRPVPAGGKRPAADHARTEGTERRAVAVRRSKFASQIGIPNEKHQLLSRHSLFASSSLVDGPVRAITGGSARRRRLAGLPRHLPPPAWMTRSRCRCSGACPIRSS